MAFALVGSLGSIQSSSTANTVLAPTYGTGESHSAGNLGICWMAQSATAATANSPTISAGWTVSSLNVPVTANIGMTIWCRVLDGTTTDVPTVTLAASSAGTVACVLGEFSGNSGAQSDQVGNTVGTTSPLTATAGNSDSQPGELVCYVAPCRLTAAATITTTVTLNNGATANSVHNDASSVAPHWKFGFGITTGNSGADTAQLAESGGTLTALGIGLVSFQVATTAITVSPDRMPLGV